MAYPTSKGNALTLIVKVWESRGQLRITGADPDLKAPGIHVPVKNGSQSELSLRYLANRLGVVWPSAAADNDGGDPLDGLSIDDVHDALGHLPDDQLRQVAAWVRESRTHTRHDQGAATTMTEDHMALNRSDNRGPETGKGKERAAEQYKLIAKSQARTGDNTVQTRRGN